MVVVPVLVHLIHEISAVRLKYPQDLRPLDNRMIVLKTIKVRGGCRRHAWHCGWCLYRTGVVGRCDFMSKNDDALYVRLERHSQVCFSVW